MADAGDFVPKWYDHRSRSEQHSAYGYSSTYPCGPTQNRQTRPTFRGYDNMPQSCNSGSYPRRPSYSSTYTRSRPRSSVGELTTRCPLVSSASSQVINEVAIVTEVSKELGRLITPSNFANPNWEIFFSLSTHLNGAPLRELTEDLTLIFYPGCQVEVTFEAFASEIIDERCFAILCCTSICISEEVSAVLEPMVIIDENESNHMLLGLTTDCDLVIAHPSILLNGELIDAFMQRRTFVQTSQGKSWPEYARVGRSVEGLMIKTPRWLNDVSSTTTVVKKMIITIQRFGRDREGFAKVKAHLPTGVVLTANDETDAGASGDMFFPYEMRTVKFDGDPKISYPIGPIFYFRACPELPGREFKYRIYSLESVDSAQLGKIIPHFSGHTLAGASTQIAANGAANFLSPPLKTTVSSDLVKSLQHHSVEGDSVVVSSAECTSDEIVASAQTIKQSPSPLIEINSLQEIQDSQEVAPRDTIPSQSIMDLLSAVDFSIPVPQSYDKLLLDSDDCSSKGLPLENPSDVETEEITDQAHPVRHYHAITNDLDASAFDFPSENTNVKSAVEPVFQFNCCAETANRPAVSSGLSHLSDDMSKHKNRSTSPTRSQDASRSRSPCNSASNENQKPIESLGNFDHSLEGSETTICPAVFTKEKIKNEIDSADRKETNDSEVGEDGDDTMSILLNLENSATDEMMQTPNVIVNSSLDDLTGIVPEQNLQTTLRSDCIYSKFFEDLIKPN